MTDQTADIVLGLGLLASVAVLIGSWVAILALVAP